MKTNTFFTAANSHQGKIYARWGIFENGRRVATMADGLTPEQEVAMARLFAGADDLLEALKLLLDERYCCGEEEEFDEAGNFTCNSPASIRAREAIAKATA